MAFCLCKSSYAEENETVTASGIMVKTQDVFALESGNINDLLEKAGSDYRNNNQNAFSGSKVSVDSNYIDLCYEVGVWDVRAKKHWNYCM